jgi:hypothetical protein
MKYLFNPFIAYIKVSMIRMRDYFARKEVIDRCFAIALKVIKINPSFLN